MWRGPSLQAQGFVDLVAQGRYVWGLAGTHPLWMCARPCWDENALPTPHLPRVILPSSRGWGVHPISLCKHHGLFMPLMQWCKCQPEWLQCNRTKRRKQWCCKEWVKCSEMEEGHALHPRDTSLSVPKLFSLTKPRVPPPEIPLKPR